MPISSRWSCEIPKRSLATYLFESPTAPLPKEPLYIDSLNPKKFVSYHAYRSLVQRIASGLLAIGLRPGDRVILFSGNNIFFPPFFNGIIAAGGIFTGANPNFTPREIEQQIRSSGARFLVAHRNNSDVAREAAENVGLDEGSVFMFDEGLDITADGKIFGWGNKSSPGQTRHWSDIVEKGYDGFVWRELRTDEELDTTATINYSSGTTGIPKGVQITHKNLVSNTHQSIYLRMQSDSAPDDSRWLGMLPMYHAYGQTFYAITAPKRRVLVYVLQKFDFGAFLMAIQKYKITSIAAVPPIMVALAKNPDVLKFDLSSVNGLGCGSAPLSRDISREAEERVMRGRAGEERVNLKQGWGMTEATCSITGFRPGDTDEVGSVGELLPNCEGKVMDTGAGSRELPPNTPGEIWVRAPNVTKGYYRNRAATEDTITPDGWLKTGDIGYYNEAGRWFIVDRKKELIKVKGNQVAPAELEGLLLEHPNVIDAAVIGIPHAEDERPRAYIVAKPGATVTADEIREWVKKRAIRYKWITGGVVLIPAVPRNLSGKILREELRDRAKTETGDSGNVAAKL
ncbi:acetyl-CoA synthetase-like protein [Tuber magnatum]|uniref:Acetyl-CoA synthetase-like protein n=1 Tax=Tuber magnatum TaxID=42249 RepID=A0A317T0G6_9PEZI|nr:acetyl-CoA synthetase-like protein [Tuber magnatum]